MEELEVFIICHDENIILENEQNKKFQHIPNYRYLFVGNGTTEKIKNNKKIIICRDLENNIEEYKTLVSFTAWYALVKNNLIQSKFVSLLEYDIDLSPDFFQKNLSVMEKYNGIIGYVVFPILHPIYFEATPWLEFSLREVFKIELRSLLVDYVKNTGLNSWCSTSNCTLSKETLINFVEWFIPLTEMFKTDPLGAHVHERSIKVFAILNGIKTFAIKNVLTHWQKKSHKIEALI